jgi:hypothetical protein
VELEFDPEAWWEALLLGCLAKERAMVREMEVISKTWRLRGLVAGEIQCH